MVQPQLFGKSDGTTGFLGHQTPTSVPLRAEPRSGRPSVVQNMHALFWKYRRHMIPIFAAISTLYGFWFIYKMDEYLPWEVRLFSGLKVTILGHVGLWLAILNPKSKIRFLVAIILLTSMFSVFFLWWTLDLAAALGTVVFTAWLMFKLLKGKKNVH